MVDVAGLPPFRRIDAATLGLSEATIRRALRAGDLVQERRGVLVGRRRLQVASDPVEQHVLRAGIALQALTGTAPAALCLGSAALLHGISRLGQGPQRIRLYRGRGGPWRDDEVAVLTCGLPSHHVVEVRGLPTTSAARTSVDLARWVTFRSAVVVMDSALHLGTPKEQVAEVIQDCSRWPGIRKARRAVAFADPRAESPLESISRALFSERGLPEPELQVPLGVDEHGYPTGIVDFYWPQFRLVGEADGLMKYDDPLALRAEKLRQEALEDLGYVVVRWTWNDIWRRPDWVIGRLGRHMHTVRPTSEAC